MDHCHAHIAFFSINPKILLQLLFRIQGSLISISRIQAITGRTGGSAIRKMMFYYSQLNRDAFMEYYYKRSNIEAADAAIKRKFGEGLKSRNQIAQISELLAKIIANLKLVLHEIYEIKP